MIHHDHVPKLEQDVGERLGQVALKKKSLFFLTLQVHCNVWSYMTFGAVYSSWLTLIHSEVQHPWDPLFRTLGLGTASDHHVRSDMTYSERIPC